MADKKAAGSDADERPGLDELLAEWDSSEPGREIARNARGSKGKLAAADTGDTEDDGAKGKRASKGKDGAEPEGLPEDALQDKAESFGDRFAPYEERLRSLEQERGRLSGDLAAARRYEDHYRSHVARFDYERLVERIEGETGLDRASIEARVRLRLAEDPEFLEAAEARYDSDAFKNLADEWVEELAESHPKVRPGSLTAAVRASREVSRGSVSDDSYGDFGKMSDQELAAAKMRVFSDVAAGRLRSSRGRGFFSSSP